MESAKHLVLDRILLELRKTRFFSDPTILTLFLVPTTVLVVFFVAPIASVIAGALSFDWSQIVSPFYISTTSSTSPVIVLNIGGELRIRIVGFNFGVIINSLLNAAIVTAAAVVLGTSVAILVGLFDFPGRRLFIALASIPLLVAPFASAYVVKLLYGYNIQGNTVSAILHTLGIPITIGVSKLAGVTLAQILAFYPIVYINVLSVIGTIDANLIEQALNLGARGFKLVRTIVLPLVVPGILAGATLVYILSLEDVGAPIIFDFRNIMSYQIFMFFQQMTAIGRAGVAAALSLLMLLFAVVPAVLVRRYLSVRYYATLTRGSPRPLRRMKLGLVGKLTAYLVILPILIAAAAPQIGVIILAFSHRWVGPFPQGATLNNFFVLFSNPGVFRGIINSITYTACAVALIAVVGFAAGYAIARARIPGVALLDALSVMPLAVPGLVVAFGYFIFLTSVARGTPLDPLVNPGAVLVIAYLVRKMPFTVRAVFTGVIRVPDAMEEAARCLSASRARVLKDVIIPLVWRSIVAGLLLSTIYVLSEVSVSVTIGALGGDITSPDHAGPITFVIMRLIQATSLRGGVQPQAVAAAMASILMGLEAFVMFFAVSRLTKRGMLLGV